MAKKPSNYGYSPYIFFIYYIFLLALNTNYVYKYPFVKILELSVEKNIIIIQNVSVHGTS